jgi:hypothetical protein
MPDNSADSDMRDCVMKLRDEHGIEQRSTERAFVTGPPLKVVFIPTQNSESTG